MIETFLSEIHVYSAMLPLKGYEIIFIFSFLEAIAFIGVLLPGTIVIAMFGFFVYLGQFNFAVTFTLCVLGALLGDLVSYYFGKRKGLEIKLGQKSVFRHVFMPDAGAFLVEQGGLAVIAGRFIGPLRAFVPFYIGAAGGKEKMFILYDIIGVLAWSAFYLVLGAVFGSSYEILKNIMNDFEFFGGIFALLVIVPLIIARLFRKKLPEITASKTTGK